MQEIELEKQERKKLQEIEKQQRKKEQELERQQRQQLLKEQRELERQQRIEEQELEKQQKLQLLKEQREAEIYRNFEQQFRLKAEECVLVTPQKLPKPSVKEIITSEPATPIFPPNFKPLSKVEMARLDKMTKEEREKGISLAYIVSSFYC